MYYESKFYHDQKGFQKMLSLNKETQGFDELNKSFAFVKWDVNFTMKMFC